MSRIEFLISAVKQVAIDVHQELGPGLFESTYEPIFIAELRTQGLAVDSQRSVPLRFRAQVYPEAYRLDLLLEGALVVEIKSTDRPSPVHARQVLTYLRCLKLRHGLVVNMGRERAIDGIDRVINFRVPPQDGEP
jgi:iron complex transport system substrate-binding protein